MAPPRDLAARAEQLRVLRAMRLGAEPFAAFVRRASPKLGPPPPHLRRLYRLIEDTRQRQVFATLSVPPRHGKTVTLGHGIAWRTIYDPACLNVYATYGQDLSESTSMTIRRLVAEHGGTPLARGKVLDWTTTYGGGLKATSVGGGITGRGVNGGLIVVDDAIKGREAAESRRERDSIWQWFIDDVMSRVEGGASAIVVNTRWHEDDLIGRLQANGIGQQWEHINLPAVGDTEGRPVDEREHPEQARPLWSGVNSADPTMAGAMAWYAAIRARGEYGWWSLYQGVPRSLDARMFSEDPPRFDAFTWEGKRGLIVLDPAATAKTSADYSALGAFAMEGYGGESRMTVVEVQRFQRTIPEVARAAMAMQARYRLPIAVEAVAGFKAVPQMLRELEPSMRIIEINPVGDKKTRAIPVSDAWQGHRVAVPAQGGWVNDYTAELRAFTGVGDANDDQVDITAHAWNRLYRDAPMNQDKAAPSVY